MKMTQVQPRPSTALAKAPPYLQTCYWDEVDTALRSIVGLAATLAALLGAALPLASAAMDRQAVVHPAPLLLIERAP